MDFLEEERRTKADYIVPNYTKQQSIFAEQYES
jgi:hypothetical protein